jgi:hypothetical protein
VERLLLDEALRAALGGNAARDARERFDVERQADAHLALFAELPAAGAPLRRS